MTYEPLQMLSPPAFKRACGISRKTFLTMTEVLKPHLDRHGKRGGQNSLSVEDQLLVTLQYWREYRTQFHSSLDFGVSESTVCRIVEKVETLLVQSGRFQLPGKQQLKATRLGCASGGCHRSGDRTAQKNSDATTVASKNATRSKPNW